MQHGLRDVLEDPAGGLRDLVEHRPRLLGGPGPPLLRPSNVMFEQLPRHAERELPLQVAGPRRQHGEPGGTGGLLTHRQQARLADPGAAGHYHDATVAATRSLEGVPVRDVSPAANGGVIPARYMAGAGAPSTSRLLMSSLTSP